MQRNGCTKCRVKKDRHCSTMVLYQSLSASVCAEKDCFKRCQLMFVDVCRGRSAAMEACLLCIAFRLERVASSAGCGQASPMAESLSRGAALSQLPSDNSTMCGVWPLEDLGDPPARLSVRLSFHMACVPRPIFEKSGPSVGLLPRGAPVRTTSPYGVGMRAPPSRGAAIG